MVTIPDISNRSVPRKDESQSAECPPDNKLPENSQENLDARLDHAIEETFPTSDPISVTITKGPEPDRPDHAAHASLAEDHQGRPMQGSTEQVLDQVREALNDVAGSAAEAAGNVYSRGERSVRQAGKHYPQVERYVREGGSLVNRYTTENPLVSLLMAGAVGYALAWTIHGKRRDRQYDVPDYGRTNRGYAPHRGEPHQ